MFLWRLALKYYIPIYGWILTCIEHHRACEDHKKSCARGSYDQSSLAYKRTLDAFELTQMSFFITMVFLAFLALVFGPVLIFIGTANL